MTIASEITDLQTNLAAAKGAVTTKGGTVGNTGLAGLASEIATIPSGGGGGTDWGVLYFHPWTGEWAGYADAESNCTASIQDAEYFLQMMNNIGLANQHMLDHPAEQDFLQVEITAQNDGSNVWEVTFMTAEGLIAYGTWYADNDPDWWEINYGISLTVDSGATDFSFAAVAQYLYSYDTSRTLSLELDQSSYNSLDNTSDHYFGWLPSASVSGFQFGTLATTTPPSFLTMAENLTSLDWTYATSLTSIGNGFLYGCTSFDSPITIPSSVTTIGAFFMYGCSSFDSPITIPSSVTTVGALFMHGCNAMVSTVYCNAPASGAATSNDTFSVNSSDEAAYTTGITLGGTYASDWKAKFPDRNSYPYRKLILAS